MSTARIAAVAVALAVAAVALWATNRLDPARLKGDIAQAVKEKKQRSLRIGELEIDYLPRLRVHLGKVSLSERASPVEFAAVDAARAEVQWLPLLEGRIVVDTVEIRGFAATLARRLDGTLNIDDLLASDEPSAPKRIEIGAVTLDDATLTWRDEKSGRSTTAAGLGLTVDKLAADTGAGTYRADTAAVAMRGKMDAALRLEGLAGSPDGVSIARIALDMATPAGVKARLESPLAAEFGAARRTLRLDRLSGHAAIEHPRLARRLDIPLQGRLEADLAGPSACLALDARFDDTAATLRADLRGVSPLSIGFELNIDRLDVDRYLKPENGSDSSPSGTFRLPSDIVLDGILNIGSLQVAGVKAGKLRLNVRTANGRLEFRSPGTAR